jgi:type VI secretion system protein ImpB
VDTGGAAQNVELPFVMGVMSDLSGDTKDPDEVKDRAFADFDVDNFDKRMKAMKPSAKFVVPNALTGEGNLAVDITFESMDDFSPAAVARKVDSLNKLLEARGALKNLLSYMDGRDKAEELVSKLLGDPALLKSLAAQAKPKSSEESK